MTIQNFDRHADLSGPFKILKKERLTPTTNRFLISAPWVARAAKPGQFVIVMASEHGERKHSDRHWLRCPSANDGHRLRGRLQVTAQRVRQRHDILIRRHREFLGDQRFEDSRVTERRASVATGRKGSHGRDRDPRIEGLAHAATTPPAHGVIVCTTRFSPIRKTLDRVVEAMLDGRALVVRPPVEFW